MPIEYKIGLYDKDKNLIGYKVDSFWGLSKKHYKTHWLEDGKIPEHLLKNLRRIINLDEKEEPANIIHGAGLVNKLRYFEGAETMLLGYVEENGGEVVFTHRITHGEIEEIQR